MCRCCNRLCTTCWHRATDCLGKMTFLLAMTFRAACKLTVHGLASNCTSMMQGLYAALHCLTPAVTLSEVKREAATARTQQTFPKRPFFSSVISCRPTCADSNQARQCEHQTLGPRRCAAKIQSRTTHEGSRYITWWLGVLGFEREHGLFGFSDLQPFQHSQMVGTWV